MGFSALLWLRPFPFKVIKGHTNEEQSILEERNCQQNFKSVRSKKNSEIRAKMKANGRKRKGAKKKGRTDSHN